MVALYFYKGGERVTNEKNPYFDPPATPCPCKPCEHRQCQYFGRDDCPHWGPYKAAVAARREAELRYRLANQTDATRQIRYGSEGFGIKHGKDQTPHRP